MAPAFPKRSRALLLGSFVYKMQRQGRIQRGVQPPLAVGYARYCNREKRVFDLVIDFGTSQSPKSNQPLTTYLCPSRPGHQALRNNFASSLLLRTCLPMTGHRVWMPTLLPLWRKACRENSAASRLLGSTSLRFALHGWQRAPQLVVGRRQKQKEMYMIEMPAGGHLWGRRSRIFVKSCRQQTGRDRRFEKP